jgi:hypothetical protein
MFSCGSDETTSLLQTDALLLNDSAKAPLNDLAARCSLIAEC